MEPAAIVWGGPVGLTLSLVLAQYGVPALVLEGHARFLHRVTSPVPSRGCRKGWNCSTAWRSGTTSRGRECGVLRMSFGQAEDAS